MLVDEIFPEDIVAIWRPLTADELAVAPGKIFEAILILEALNPPLQSRVDSGSLSVQMVRMVVARMVSRYFKNPDGDRSVSDTESIDDYSKTRAVTKDNVISSGDMMPSEQELKWLGIRSRSAFEVKLRGSR